MTSSVASKALSVIHEKPPRQVIQEALKGFLSDVEITNTDVLLCIYERPEKTSGGIIMPETASRRAEDKFQGTVGLVVKIGPNYHDTYDRKVGLEPRLKIGDWVLIRRGDGWGFVLGDRVMVQIQGDYIRTRVQDPDSVI